MNPLTLKQVSFKYADAHKEVLKNISVTFEAGKVYGIIGKSGSGKTTMLSLLSGMDLCTKGDIYYHDQSMKTMDRDRYRANGVGVIFQNYNLLTNATVLDNILLAIDISGSVKKNKKQTALQVLSKVGINEEKAKRKVLKLSGGEQQRVGIARALVTNADIIIADEPTGHLDPETEQAILDILVRLAHEENKCVIIVTHSEHITKKMDKVWALQAGQLKAVE